MRIEINPEMLKEELLGTYRSPEGIKFPKNVEISVTAFVKALRAVVDPEIHTNWIFNELGTIILDRWIREGEIYYTDEDVQTSLERAAIRSAADDLVRDGILDVIEDENGEEVIFITEKGKKVAKEWGIEGNNSEDDYKNIK